MSRATHFACAASVMLLALSGCVAPGEGAADEARTAVHGDVDARLGTQPHDDPGAVADARIQALLADGIDEDEAVRIALLSNREIVAGYAELGVGAADLEQASLWANPILDVGFLFFGDGTEIDLGLTQSFVDVLPFQRAKPRPSTSSRHGVRGSRARSSRTRSRRVERT